MQYMEVVFTDDFCMFGYADFSNEQTAYGD